MPGKERLFIVSGLITGLGAPEDAAGWMLNSATTILHPGMMSTLNLTNFPFDDNGIHYQFMFMDTFF